MPKQITTGERDILGNAMIYNAEFLPAIRSRAARIAVGPSTARGQGVAGVVEASRAFLRSLDLGRFGTENPMFFARELDSASFEFVASLPGVARSWGLARKLLNIFLRDCLYTVYLRDHYHLGPAEPVFGLPLDSITGGQLRREAGRAALPPWPGVRHVTPQISELYQRAAAQVATQRGVCRVHLDAYWWSWSRDSQ